MPKEITLKLAQIQRELKAPKNQRNNFGNYNYRSCEDIMEAVKPLLNDFFLIVTDEVVMVGERYYVKATASLSNGEESLEATAYARESLDKKGMDEAQITGAASSYARKYALNGLFAIDDTKDADTQDNTTKSQATVKQVASKKVVSKTTKTIDVGDEEHIVDVVIPDGVVCTECGVGVDKAVESFSKGRYGRILCRDCQKRVKK